MSMNISVRKLQIFVLVARYGQVTRVAEELLLSQAAVSMALAALERQHGGALFERRGRRLLLNERGRLLLPQAQTILAELEDFSRRLEDTAEQPMGHLCIGASSTIGNYLLPRLVATFSRRYPQIRVSLSIDNSENIANAVENAKLDMGLIEGPCHLGSLNCRMWRDDELVVIAAPEHAWAQRQLISMDDLLAGDWIVREAGSGTREVFEQALHCPINNLASVIELGHTEAIKKAVEAGLGVSCLSRLAVQRELDNGWLIEVPTRLSLKRELSIVTHRKRSHSRLLDACMEILCR